MKKSRIIAKNGVLEFVIEMYGIPDPVLCVWQTDEPPKSYKSDDGSEQFDLEQAELFIKEDVESIFIPQGLIIGQWNKVIICLKHFDRPIIGWLMGSTPESFLPNKWIKEVD